LTTDKAERLPLATDREIAGRIWNLSWPTILFSALEASLGLADLLMVRSLGPEATAAVGICRQITFLVNSVALALASGVIAIVSQAVGANRWDTVGQVMRQSFLLVVLAALPVGILGALVSGGLLAALNADGPTIAHATPYLQVCLMGTVFTWSCVVGAAFFRSLGDALSPLKLAVAIACINVPLNYCFIHGLGPLPALGVEGAAIGTIAATICGAIGYFLLLSRQVESRPEMNRLTGAVFSFDRPLLSRILRIGTPMALAGLVRNGSRLVFLMIVGAGAMGMTLHAAVGVGLHMRLFSVLPALAFQVATAALVGQAIGRSEFDEARRLGRRSVQLLAVIMTAVVAAIIVFAGPIAQLLVKEENVASVTVTVLRWFAVAQFFSSLDITLQGALLGAGDTLPNLRYTIITQWLVMLPLTLLASATVDWQLHGAMFAWTVAPSILLVLLARRFRGIEEWNLQE